MVYMFISLVFPCVLPPILSLEICQCSSPNASRVGLRHEVASSIAVQRKCCKRTMGFPHALQVCRGFVSVVARSVFMLTGNFQGFAFVCVAACGYRWLLRSLRDLCAALRVPQTLSSQSTCGFGVIRHLAPCRGRRGAPRLARSKDDR